MSAANAPLLTLAALLVGATTAHADAVAVPRFAPTVDSNPVDTPPRAPAKKPVKRYVAHANLGMVAMNWQGAADGMPSKMVTVADRQTLNQMVGVGRFMTPTLRVTLSVQTAEVVGGGAPGASSLALVGFVPWLGWHPGGPVFLGAGPLIAPRIYGKNQLDLGVFTAAGVAFPLGHGFSAGASVQVPVMLRLKTAVSIAPATFVAYRF